MKNQVLQLLRGAESYVSGQEICDRFGVSRTAVWKIVNQLKEEGYEIEAVKNRGYHLVSAPDVITEAEICSLLHTEYMGRNCVFFPATDSTNVQLRRLAEEGAPEGTMVLADSQSAGRGRGGRVWVSKPGEHIFFSLLLRPHMRPANASMLTLVMGLSAARACQEILKEAGSDSIVQIKWPNDLVIDGRKICGTLTEMSAEMEAIHYLIIGTGINVNGMDFTPELADRAAALCQAAGKKLHRAEILARVLQYFEQDYGTFLRTEDLSGLQEEYDRFLVNKDRGVRVLDPAGEYTGTARGINARGELLVDCDGELRNVYAGEVSVRGVYGYV